MANLNLDQLGDEVSDAYNRWQEAQHKYLEAVENCHLLKFHLSRTIDALYAEGVVIGKNEREREAWLRSEMTVRYIEVDRVEHEVIVLERTLRDAEIAAESIKLRVAIALGSLALMK